MSGIGDQGLRPSNVEPAPADEETSETDERQENAEQEPSTEDLQEPSTEKEPGEEPKAPENTQEPPPSHEAVGIGVIGRPQTETEETSER